MRTTKEYAIRTRKGRRPVEMATAPKLTTLDKIPVGGRYTVHAVGTIYTLVARPQDGVVTVEANGVAQTFPANEDRIPVLPIDQEVDR